MIIDADRTDAPLAADRPEADRPPPVPKKRGGGPRTPQGRERSRRNSLKHGLCSKVVLTNDLGEKVARRTEEFTADFQPRSPYAAFQVRQMALAAARLDLCAEMTVADVRRVMHRARVIWDHDRRVAVEGLGAKLAKDPSRVAPALRGCKQGSDWLMDRWEVLGDILKAKGTWTDEQRRLAWDLLGVPVILRDSNDLVPPPDDIEGLAALVEQQLAILAEDQEAVLNRLDAEERAMAMQGMPLEEDAASARLRKYEGSCRRAFNAAKAELLRLREEATVAEAEPARSEPEPGRRAEALAAEAEAAARRAEADLARARGAAAEPPAVAEAPKAAATVAPVPTRSSMVPAPALNRRERRAQAKRDRQAARRAGR
jgi:hypothetical protein